MSPDAAAGPVAVHRVAKLDPRGNTQAVAVGPVALCVDNDKAANGAVTLGVEPAKYMVLL